MKSKKQPDNDGYEALLQILTERFRVIWADVYGKRPTKKETDAYLFGVTDGIDLITGGDGVTAKSCYRSNIPQ